MTTHPGPWWNSWHKGEGALILHVDLRPDDGRERRALSFLDDEERRRWDGFVVKGARRRFSLCRAALRINLCERLGCANDALSFGYLEHGKPFAKVNGTPSPLSFNVSHSGSNGLIAFAEHDGLGVDLEERAPDRNFDGIGSSVYGPAEQRVLTAARGRRKADLFYRLWSLKEALIKALGTGFALNPSRFEVPPAMLGGARSSVFRFPHAPSDRWWLMDLGEPRFAAALAYRLPSRDTDSHLHVSAN
ncbi:MAG: 4'-phosphopantetheinyl transferase superfamily protein [Acidobacteria bacterium]|nr:4'-phosphopantetheinyl transferase superfamily protein [Acidobacteriota bacterium]MYE43537.1 4'-phosphopantetheinyl transferase superfamily protein [Acidobacteriota bacterium]